MRVAAILFGISQYEDVGLNRGSNALRYAANDAESFERYVRAAWSTASHLSIECWTDRDATSAQWLSSIERIAVEKPDLFVAYLAGHALPDGENSSAFCLADAKDRAGILKAEDFDRAFRSVGARTSVLFLDCCHAEAVIAKADFFHVLEDSAARLFLCSARGGQRAWEDAAIRHGLFSNAVISGLAEISPLTDVDGYVEIERLFGFVCDDVSRRAFAARNRERQEPVRGGLSSARLRLPTASVAVLGRQISTYEVVAIAFRRWLTRAAMLLFAAIAISDLSFQHLLVDAEGSVVAHSGLPIFEPLRRAIPGGVIDTGFDRDNLYIYDPTNTEVFDALENRRLVGSRLWASTAWPANLGPLLATEERREFSILLHGRLQEGIGSENADLNAPPIEELVTLRVLNPNLHRTAIDNVFDYGVPNVDLDCGEDAFGTIDLTHLNPPSIRFLRELDWRLSTANSIEERASRFAAASRLVGYRYAHARVDDIGDWEYYGVLEFERLADWAVSDQYGGTAALPVENGDSWCSLVNDFVAALTAGRNRALDGEEALGALVETYNSDLTGDLVVGDAELGLALLAIVARLGSLEDATIDQVTYFLRSDSRGLNGTPQFVEWLVTVAPWIAFPEDTLTFLFESLLTRGEDDEFSRLVAFNILARNAQHLNQGNRDIVVRWAEDNVSDLGTFDQYVDGVSYIVSFLPEEFVREYLSTVIARTDAGRAIDPPSESWRGDMLVAPTDVIEWNAISRVAQVMPVAQDIVTQLLRFAVVAPSKVGREEALRAVANQRRDIRTNDWGSFRRSLVQFAADGQIRGLLSEAAGLHICGMPVRERAVETGVIRSMWVDETVPILRLGLAETLKNASVCLLTE